MAFLDGLIFYATLIIGIALLIPERVQSKVQGIATLVFSFLLVMGCLVVVFADFELLLLMVSLLMSVPFVTAAYIIGWGQFDTDGARVALSLLMTLIWIVFSIGLLIAWIMCLIKAFQGQYFKLPVIGNFAEKFSSK